MFIVYETNLWSVTVCQDFKLTTNTDPDRYKYSGYGIGFDASGSFLLSDGSGFDKNVIVFGADMS